MADRIKGITIEIGGDTTKLSTALKGVNKEIKSTQDQLKDVDRLLKLDPKNTELLRQKQVLLKQAISQTGDKLKTLNEAEKQLKNAGVDKNSEQFMALRREIAATESQHKQLTDESKKTAKALKENTTAAKAAHAAYEGLKGAAKVAGTAIAAVGTAAATATVAATKAMVDATVSGAKYADELLTQSEITGISTDKLQEYAYAAELVDVSVDTMTGAMARSIRSMSAAREGTGAAAEAYATLGVSVLDSAGELRDSEDVFWDTIEALGKIDNETERDALAMELFGKSAQELNPLIAAGSDKMKALAEEAHAAGAVLDNETLQAYGAFDDELQKLKNNAGAAKNALGTALLPVLTELGGKGVEALSMLTGAINAADGDIGQMVDNILGLLPALLKELEARIPEVLAFVQKLFAQIVTAVAQALPSIIQTVVTLLPSLIQTIIDSIPVILAAFWDVVNALIDWLVQPDTLANLITAAIQLVVAIASGIIKGLPELIARLPELVLAIADALIQNLPILLDAIWEIIGAVISAFSNVDWGKVWEGIVNAAKRVWENVKKIFEPVGNWFKKIWDGIVSGLKAALNIGIKAINKLIEGVNKFIAPVRKIISQVGNLLGSNLTMDDVKIPSIPMLARGGVLASGSAIVGEAGPELLTMAGNRAVVTPLTTNNNTVDAPVTINIYAAKGQNVNELADAVARRIQLHVSSKMGAY